MEETKEVSEDSYLDLDNKGNLVGMTVEHAREKANISEVSHRRTGQGLPRLPAGRVLRRCALRVQPPREFETGVDEFNLVLGRRGPDM